MTDMEPQFLEPDDADKLFGELMTKSSEITKWNRKQAMKLLDKANEIEERAATVASKYRELAASLIIEAQAFAEDTFDLLEAEFPLEDRIASTEIPDE